MPSRPAKPNRPTLNEIAQRCKVNKGTVSRVLNGKFEGFHVSKVKIKEIKTVARAMGYKPHRMARIIRCNRSYMIGISFLRFDFSDNPSDVENQIQELSSFIRVMETHPLSDKYDFVLHSRREQKDESLTDLDFKSDLLEGMIYLLPTTEHKEFLDIASPDFPIVLVGNIPGASKKVPCIDINNRKAAKNAVRHFFEMGRNNILMLIPENIRHIQCIKDRIRGYKDALTEAKIPSDKQQIHYVPSGTDALHDVLSSLRCLKKTDAIFCPSDLLAADCIAVLKGLKYNVPEDIAVIGFSNSQISQLNNPTISTVGRQTAEQAYRSIDMLLNILEKNIEYAPGFTEIDTELIRRQSTEGQKNPCKSFHKHHYSPSR